MRSSLLFPRIKHARTIRAPHAPAVTLRERMTGVCVPPSDSLVEYAAYIGGKKIDALGIPDALDLVRGHNAAVEGANAFVWVGLHEPDAPEVEWLAEVFGLHPLAVEDAVKAHQRPKVERYGDSLFMVLKTIAYLDHDELTATSEIIGTGEIMVFVGPDFVVTVRHGGHCPLARGARAPGGQAQAAGPGPRRRAARDRRPRRRRLPRRSPTACRPNWRRSRRRSSPTSAPATSAGSTSSSAR